MKLKYSLVIAVVGLLWALVNQFVPDFPIDPATFNAVVLGFVLYVLSKLGVEVVDETVIARFFR